MGDFGDAVNCPVCGTWGAKKSFWKVKCVNPACEKYDSDYAHAFQQNRIVGKAAEEVFEYLKGDADPNEYSLKIRYRNFRGDEIVYSADPKSVYRIREHAVARLAPTGKRVAFKLSSIQNRDDIDVLLNGNPFPTARERRVLRFHLRRGSSSPLFEELRGKYPNFQS